MQYSSMVLAALVATGTLAAPWTKPAVDNSIRVILQNQATETGSQTVFTEGYRQQKPPVGSSGPFETVEIDLGADVQNKDLRCQVLDGAGKPIVATRGANTDITFSDADKGAWTFKQPSTVSTIICDPAFMKADPSDSEIRVQLSNQAIELGTQTAFPDSSERQEKSASGGPFETVEIIVGALVQKQDIRCQVLDMAGQALVARRNANVDTTFSDADKGAWTFEHESHVSKIVCDPAFKSVSA